MAVVVGKEGPAGLWGCLLLGVKEEAPERGGRGARVTRGGEKRKDPHVCPVFLSIPLPSPDPGA